MQTPQYGGFSPGMSPAQGAFSPAADNGAFSPQWSPGPCMMIAFFLCLPAAFCTLSVSPLFLLLCRILPRSGLPAFPLLCFLSPRFSFCVVAFSPAVVSRPMYVDRLLLPSCLRPFLSFCHGGERLLDVAVWAKLWAMARTSCFLLPQCPPRCHARLSAFAPSSASPVLSHLAACGLRLTSSRLHHACIPYGCSFSAQLRHEMGRGFPLACEGHRPFLFANHSNHAREQRLVGTCRRAPATRRRRLHTRR